MDYKISWTSPKLIVNVNEKINEKGVFANKSIKKDEKVAIFGGFVMDFDTFNKMPENLQIYAYQIDDGLFFGPANINQLSTSEFFNHSCSPNAGFIDSIILVAIKDIKKGEEVTFDYAMCMTSDFVDMKCLCMEKNCRKEITGDDWKNKKLQKKIGKYFVPYIKNKIHKEK